MELDKIEVALEAPLKLNFYMIAKKRKVDLSKDVKSHFIRVGNSLLIKALQCGSLTEISSKFPASLCVAKTPLQLSASSLVLSDLSPLCWELYWWLQFAGWSYYWPHPSVSGYLSPAPATDGAQLSAGPRAVFAYALSRGAA